MYLADRVVFQMITTIISLYRVEPLEGCKIPDPNSIKYTPTTITYVFTSSPVGHFLTMIWDFRQPVDFECRFVLRDEKARNLLKMISLDE
jgi:hypothetical protein